MRTMMTRENWFSRRMDKVRQFDPALVALEPRSKCPLSDRSEYAQVIKMLGNGRLEAQCFDGEKRLAHIRGKMRKKVCYFVSSISYATSPNVQNDANASARQVWINQGDIILLSLRDFQDDKADVIVKYTADEARNRKSYKRPSWMYI